jgi:hypothetical protein
MGQLSFKFLSLRMQLQTVPWRTSKHLHPCGGSTIVDPFTVGEFTLLFLLCSRYYVKSYGCFKNTRSFWYWLSLTELSPEPNRLDPRIAALRLILLSGTNKTSIKYRIGGILPCLYDRRITFLRRGSLSILEIWWYIRFSTLSFSNRKTKLKGESEWKMASQAEGAGIDESVTMQCNILNHVLRPLKITFCELFQWKVMHPNSFYQQPISHNAFSTNLHL